MVPDISGTGDSSQCGQMSAEELIQISEDRYVVASLMEQIYKDYPDIKSEHPEARTWKELKRCAERHSKDGLPLEQYLVHQQVGCAFADNGLTSARSSNHKTQARITSRLRSRNLFKLEAVEDLKLVDKDCVVVRAWPKDPEEEGYSAEMSNQNVMTLYPDFFAEWWHDSLVETRVVPETHLRELCTPRVRLVLHELCHS